MIIGNSPSDSFASKTQRERHLVDFVMSTIRRSEHETMPTRNQWRTNDKLFLGEQDWGPDSEREDWRSRLFIHEYAPIIREAATAAQNQIFSRADFVNLVAGDNADPAFAEVLKKLILYYLDQIGFSQKFYEWCLCGGIYGIATWKIFIQNRLVWRPEIIVQMVQKEQDKQTSKLKAANKDRFLMPGTVEDMQGGLEAAMQKIFGPAASGYKRDIMSKKNLETAPCLEVTNPFDFFWEPDVDDINDSPWTAERSFKKWPEVVKMLEAGEVDSKKRDRILSDSRGRPGANFVSTETYQGQKLRQKQQFSNVSTYWATVEMFEYFGPILGPNGDVIDEMRQVIIANGKYVVKDSPVGYWNQRHPYRTAIFNRKPFKPTGVGIADAAVNSQITINELFSLFVDALRLDVYAPLGVNDDMLVDKTQVDAGIRPGETIHLFNGKASDAFTPMPKSSNTAPELFQTLEFLKLAGQKGSSVNTMSSNPSSRARISAKEVQSNDSRRVENLNSLGFEIDVSGIEPLVEQVKELIIQFGFTQSNLQLLGSKGVLNEAEYQSIAGMPPQDRFEEAMKSMKVEVRGFRAALERDQYLSRLGECMQQIIQMPPPVQQMIDWKYLVKEFATAYGLKADKLIRQEDEGDRAREENIFLQNGQMVGTTPNDDDPTHLTQHYGGFMTSGPNPAIAQHIMAHIHQATGKGLPVPPPPPEVAAALGLPPPPTPDQKEQMNVGRNLLPGGGPPMPPPGLPH